MARVQLNLKTLIAAVQDRVEAGTTHRCYDDVPVDAQSPFYAAEVTSVEKANSKTMYRDKITVWVHCIAAPPAPGEANSSVGVYNLIQELQEAMTENITLPTPYYLIDQSIFGPLSIQTDETNEKHAIMSLEFMVAYGFICKN